MLMITARSKVWMHEGPGGWHFITLPKKHAKTINVLLESRKRGWGSVRVNATIGKTTWKTSIFPDKKSGSYVLPVKASVRMKEEIADGDVVKFALSFND